MMDNSIPFVVGGYGGPAYVVGDIGSPYYAAAQAQAELETADYYRRQAEEGSEDDC